METALDKTGRLVVPKKWRDQLRLRPGDPIEIELEDEAIVLRPASRSVPVKRKNGLWTFDSGTRMSAADTRRALEADREEHERHDRD